MDYRQSGVDIDAGNETVRRIKSLARATFTPGVLSDIGSFGGLFRLDRDRFQDPVLVSSADGVGTKLKVAFMTGRHDTIGGDLVNHCINDILVQGAEPLFFLDYLATGRLSPDVAEQVVSGIARACRENGCALIGGETAEMPGFYADGEYDLAGFIVGAVDRTRIVDGRTIVPGDVLIGLPSAGLHTNGYSLARRVFFDVAGLQVDTIVAELGVTAGAALLAPHRCYLPMVRPLLDGEYLKGLAHITGGGITENVPRILPEGCAAEIDLDAWTVPPIFRFIQHRGVVGRDEMYRTFNMGVGLVVACTARDADRVISGVARAGEPNAYVLVSSSQATGLSVMSAGEKGALSAAGPLSRRIGVLISGRGSNLQSIIDAIVGRRLDAGIAIVVSNREDAAGLKRAADAGIDTRYLPPRDYVGRDAYDRALAGVLETCGVNLVCLAGFMRLVGPPLLDAFPNRILNIHPSLLPAFPGLNAQQQALEYGVRFSGATVHLVTSELDGGPIVLQATVPVVEGDTVETLSARILVEEHRIYPEAIRILLDGDCSVQGRRFVSGALRGPRRA